MPNKPGKVIVLNGPSSSGKTSIAKALQRALDDVYLHVSIDAFLHQLPDAVLADQTALARAFPRLFAGFNAANAALVHAGNNLIIDVVLQEPSWVSPCVKAFDGLEAIFVGVRCALDVLEDRERARGDRKLGLARYQHDRVHSHGVYDIEVDTATMPVTECVARIVTRARSEEPPTAFQTLRLRSSAPSAG
jgi:chloramphenicol 3-O phosphotransferase